MPIDPYVAASGLPAEEEIAQTVMTDVLPQLRSLLAQLKALQDTWLVNDIQAKIAVAATNGSNLAGFPPDVWAKWGTVLTAQLMFLDAPIPEIGATPKQVLLTRYVKAQA